MKQKWMIALTGGLLGILASSQYLSYKKVFEIVARDSNTNIFSEIQVLKGSNEALEEEIRTLKARLDESSDQWSAQEALRKEITEKQMLLGIIPVVGAGVSIQIGTAIEAMWLVDIINELYTAGAEAISINGIRLTVNTVGFDGTLGTQVLLQGSLLSPPYTIKAVGDKKVLEQALTQAGGLSSRLKLAYPDLHWQMNQEDRIEMPGSRI